MKNVHQKSITTATTRFDWPEQICLPNIERNKHLPNGKSVKSTTYKLDHAERFCSIFTTYSRRNGLWHYVRPRVLINEGGLCNEPIPTDTFICTPTNKTSTYPAGIPGIISCVLNSNDREAYQCSIQKKQSLRVATYA